MIYKLDEIIDPIRAKEFLHGGYVRGKSPKYKGQHIRLDYKIKDSDSVPAILTPGEYVLTRKMIKRVKTAFQKAKMKPLKGL
jgi:hypothetical protein